MIPPSLPFVVVSAGKSVAVVSPSEVGGSSAGIGSTEEGVVQAPASNSMGMMNFRRRMGPPGQGRFASADDPKMIPVRVRLQHTGSTK